VTSSIATVASSKGWTTRPLRASIDNSAVPPHTKHSAVIGDIRADNGAIASAVAAMNTSSMPASN
jgi:hypothetical protein